MQSREQQTIRRILDGDFKELERPDLFGIVLITVSVGYFP